MDCGSCNQFHSLGLEQFTARCFLEIGDETTYLTNCLSFCVCKPWITRLSWTHKLISVCIWCATFRVNFLLSVWWLFSTCIFFFASFISVLYCLQFSSCFCCMYNYPVCVENVLSVADLFGMLTVKIKISCTLMSQFSMFRCVCILMKSTC
jgi:hypothetical protein